jgi:hypothetical protein
MIPTFLTDSKGNVFLNEAKRYVKNSFLTPDISQLPIAIPAAPSATIPSQSAPVIIEGGEDAITEIYASMGEHAAAVLPDVQDRMTVEILDTAYRRKLMNRPIPVNHVFGDNLQPLFWPESSALLQQQTMAWTFFNNSTAGPTDFQFLLDGGKYQASVLLNPQVTERIAEIRRRKPFLTPLWITTPDRILIGTGATVDIFFRITRDIFFFPFTRMGFTLMQGAGAVLQDNYLAQVFDAKTDRPLQNQPVLESCFVGTAQFPKVLPHSIVVEPNTSIRMKIQNINPDPIEVFITWFGVSNFVSVENLLLDRDRGIPVPTPFEVGAP